MLYRTSTEPHNLIVLFVHSTSLTDHELNQNFRLKTQGWMVHRGLWGSNEVQGVFWGQWGLQGSMRSGGVCNCLLGRMGSTGFYWVLRGSTSHSNKKLRCVCAARQGQMSACSAELALACSSTVKLGCVCVRPRRPFPVNEAPISRWRRAE